MGGGAGGLKWWEVMGWKWEGKVKRGIMWQWVNHCPQAANNSVHMAELTQLRQQFSQTYSTFQTAICSLSQNLAHYWCRKFQMPTDISQNLAHYWCRKFQMPTANIKVILLDLRVPLPSCRLIALPVLEWCQKCFLKLFSLTDLKSQDGCPNIKRYLAWP